MWERLILLSLGEKKKANFTLLKSSLWCGRGEGGRLEWDFSTCRCRRHFHYQGRNKAHVFSLVGSLASHRKAAGAMGRGLNKDAVDM